MRWLNLEIQILTEDDKLLIRLDLINVRLNLFRLVSGSPRVGVGPPSKFFSLGFPFFIWYFRSIGVRFNIDFGTFLVRLVVLHKTGFLYRLRLFIGSFFAPYQLDVDFS